MKTGQFIIFILIVLVSMLLQGYKDLLSIAGIKPDLLLMILIYFSLKEGSFHGIWIGFFLGLLQDSMTIAPLGWYALPKALCGYLVGRFGNALRGESLISLGGFIFAVSFLHSVMVYILALVFLSSMVQASFSIVFPEALFNAVLAPMLFTLYDRFFRAQISGGKIGV